MIPDFIRLLFTNPIFRIVFLSLLIVFPINKQPIISLTIAFIFVAIMTLINQEEIKENMEYLRALTKMDAKNI